VAVTLSLTVNGKPVTATVDPRTLLVEYLRQHLNLTGTHVGCDTAQCGSCTVHVDGHAVKSCNVLLAQVNGAKVVTIEGLAARGVACAQALQRRGLVGAEVVDVKCRMGFQPRRHRPGEALAVDRQGPAGRHLMSIARRQDDRVQPPHLGVQQAHGVAGPVVGAEGVGADQFGQLIGVVGLGAANRPHLVQDHRNPGLGDLPGGFRAREAAADYVDGCFHHVAH